MGSFRPREEEEDGVLPPQEEVDGPPPSKMLKQDDEDSSESMNGPIATVTNGLQSEDGGGEGERTEAEMEEIRRKEHEEMMRKLDEENKDKYKCKLCVKKPKYFEKLYEIHEHLQEFHIVPNNEEDVQEQIIQPLEPPVQPSYLSTRELLGEMTEEVRDPKTQEPMTFYPTYDEFKDLKSFCKKLEATEAYKAGICKVVVPPEWMPRKAGYNPSEIDLTIPGPVRQNISTSQVDGAFKTIADRSIPAISIEKYMRLATDDKHLTPPHNSYEELEKLYWEENLDEKKQAPIYGADVNESITDPEVTVWNINKLDSILTDVLDDQIPGVNTPYLYFGMWKATFSWHVEDMDLYAVNYLHYGAPKTWYGIPPSEGHKLEQVARKLFPDMAKTCFNLMRHKAIMISPELLRAHGIQVNKLVQEERNMIIAFPHAYHSGFNHGFNMAESTNFAIDRWVEYGKRFRDCLCRGSEDEVSIEIAPFVERYQPDQYEAWKMKENYNLHPEDPWYIRRCLQDGTQRFERGEITEAEFNNLKKQLRKKRQIPFWFKQKFEVDYYDDIRCTNVDMTDCIDAAETKEEDPELEEKLIVAKRNLIKKRNKKLEINIRKMKSRTAQVFLTDLQNYTEMRDSLIAEEGERKRKAALGYSQGNSGQALGGGQARGVGFKNVNQDDLLEKRAKVICRAKKNHRFKACSKCSGCKKTNCGECEYCLDMPRFGGSGLLKQKCETRICINPLLRTCEHCEWV